MPRSIAVVAFYQDQATARRVLQDLRGMRFRRSASVYKSQDGRVHIADNDMSSWQGAVIGAGLGLLAGLLGHLVLLHAAILGLACAVAGGLVACFDLGVSDRLLAAHRRRILVGETLIIVQVSSHDSERVLALLRQSGYSITAFAFRPERAMLREFAVDPLRKHVINPEPLAAHAAMLGTGHAILPVGRRDTALLSRLRQSRQILVDIQQVLMDGVRIGQSMIGGAEWLLDNGHLVQAEIVEVLANLPPRYYQELPAIAAGMPARVPRIYDMAAEIIAHTDSHLDRESILLFLRSYRHDAPLTSGELWALPLLLRLGLIENLRRLSLRVYHRQYQHEWADFWANRILSASRQGPDQLLFMLAELAHEHPVLLPYFTVRLLGHLRDEPAALAPLQGWLERKLDLAVPDLVRQEQNAQSADQVSIANIVGSLRFLERLPWKEIFEEVSPVEAALRDDPAGVYPQMDFATRGHYRRVIEETARWSGQTELEAARAAVEMARLGPEGSKEGHVGYYLIGGGRSALEERLGCRPPMGLRLTRWIRRHPTGFYLGCISWLTLAIAGGAVALTWGRAGAGLLVLLGLLASLPASELAVQIVNLFITRVLSPAALPRLSFTEGIPDRYRTLIVVPTMLPGPEAIADEIRKLEVRYLANQDANLFYALLTDFPDAPARAMPEHEELLQAVIAGIRRLNEQYGDRFFLFHRPLTWSESEQRWIGWERKRGKIEELNRYLATEPEERDEGLLMVGEDRNLRGICFVITLDSDTQLSRDAARKLVETAAHPLNKARLSEDGRTVRDGYTIIQPLVRTSLPSATATLFSRLFSDPSGTDPYCHLVSDVYQDLAGEGTFYGKGLYDVEVFRRVLEGRFAEATILSHDLLEGAYVRVGLAYDIELFDLFPAGYQAFIKRKHRWIRGDWQIAGWLLPRVRGKSGGERNPLPGLNRWKIADNLRRSLIPAASVGLLLLAWFATRVPTVWSAFLGIVVLFPALPKASLLGKGRREWTSAGTAAIKGLIDAALLLHQAGVAADAIARVWHRRLISHRRLLEWETAGHAYLRWRAGRGELGFLGTMAIYGLLAAGLGLALRLYAPASLVAAAPFLGLWTAAPLLAWRLNAPPRWRRAHGLSPADLPVLRRIARRTWRFFDDMVGARTNWLPPDNYQEALNVAVARRTSATNIGLWLLSALAARDFGYLTTDGLIERVGATMETLDGLEKHEGHLFNWYDTETLEPLRPRYVSTVDSGNLLASLWTLAEGCRGLWREPFIDLRVLRGLADTLSALREAGLPSTPGLVDDAAALDELLADPPAGLAELVDRIARIAALTQAIGAKLETLGTAGDEIRYWAARLECEAAAWASMTDRYLAWAKPLAAAPVPEDVRFASATVPSLQDLAHGLPALDELFVSSDGQPGSAGWQAAVAGGYARARAAAGKALASLEALAEAAGRLADGMNLRFLYDPDRLLFATGYNVNEAQLDDSYYDLLASEARLASYVAIAKGDVPAEHWAALGRPFGAAFGRAVLLSWNGTMFEYLLPLLFNRTYANSLLDEAVRTAVAVQREYGRRLGIPWGISESAFSALDAKQVYQYRAFGVPGLGLKRGLEDDLVVAAYATALALAVDPASAAANLQRLVRLGLLGPYGFYEAIDYTRERRPEGERGVAIYAYMAHHSGMTLVALDNALHDGVMQTRFHADLRVRATEPLLFERIPSAPPIIEAPFGEGPALRLRASPSGPNLDQFTTPHTPTPRTHLLSNGSYTVMVTNAGGGYSQWRGLDITRWRADTTRDNWGSYCYLRDLDEGSLWSVAYHPVDQIGRYYAVRFTVDRVAFHRRDFGLNTLMEVTVSPGDDAEIRRLTLTNRSLQTRRLEVTSLMELALAPHGADRAHPAFAKLFVETEALPTMGGLLAWRRRRTPDDPPVWVGHVVALGERQSGLLEYESDRARFLGRGRTPRNPQAMSGPLASSTGAVLDPAFSLRCLLRIEPAQKVRLAFVTVAAETRQGALELMEKYRNLEAVNMAMEAAWTNAQLELRHLGIEAEEARCFQELGGHILYPDAMLRTSVERLRLNNLGQARLWAHGISGDLPIIAVLAGDDKELGLVREALLAHAYLRTRGLMTDLVILAGENAVYGQPLQQKLRELLTSKSLQAGLDRPGGVFLRAANQMPQEDLTLILASARVTLVAARGPLARQLGAPAEAVEFPPRLKGERLPEEPSTPLPFMKLLYFNGLGGFTGDGREYAIYLEPGKQTPAPWINVLANPGFGALVSESGPGLVWGENSQSNRLTPWSNDAVLDPPSVLVYLRDEDTGVYWTPTPQPIREDDPYRARHGAGYTVFEHNSHAIDQELTVFVPLDETGGDPVLVQRLRLKNRSSRQRRLTVTGYVDWVLGTEREDTQMHIVTRWDPEIEALLARNAYHPDFNSRIAFVAVNPAATSYTADRGGFLGRNGNPARPAALDHQYLSGRTGPGLDPCAAVQTAVVLDPGEMTEVVLVLGQCANPERLRQIIGHYRDPLRVEAVLQATIGHWDRLLGAVQVHTPDPALNILFNRWLLYQVIACRIWARSAFYQSGGAFGFRDQLQDAMALIHAAPEKARAQILLAAGRQFIEGDVQHWWHPQTGAGTRTRCSDDLLWLPYVTAHYVRATGDRAILEARVPFLEGRLLDRSEQEAYLTPSLSMDDVDLFEHCRRAVVRGLTAGPHGLPLIGAGDWNDGLNRVGWEGRGESVWLAWFLVEVLREFADLCMGRGESALAEEYRGRADSLLRDLEAQAWDGEWYRRAFFDDGTPLGTANDREWRIDLLPQAWAAITGAAEPERTGTALRSAEEHLVWWEDRLIAIAAPPFDRSALEPGYIKGYPPGVRENGGQYTHAAVWLALAFARRGDGNKAAALLRLLNPIEHTRTPEDVERYKVEPYAVAGDVYTLEGRVGQGGWTWYTGSASWMYRAWLEEVLGLHREGDGLRVDPVIPAEWREYRMEYQYGGSRYEIVVSNPDGRMRGVAEVVLDGRSLPGRMIPLVDDGSRHLVQVRMG